MAKTLILPKRYHPDFISPRKRPISPIEVESSFKRNLVFLHGMRFSGANDLTGNYPATLAGNVARGIGADGEEWQFDGSGDYLNLGTMGGFGDNLANHPTTVFARLKVNITTTTVPFGTGNSGNNTVLQGSINRNFGTGGNAQGRVYFRLRGEGNVSRTVEAQFDTGVSDGGYHNLLFIIHPNASGEIWLDGVQLSVTQVSSQNVSNTANFQNSFDIGSLNWKGTHGTDGYFNGSMPLIAVWERELSDAEKRQITTNPYTELLKPAIPQLLFPAAVVGEVDTDQLATLQTTDREIGPVRAHRLGGELQ